MLCGADQTLLLLSGLTLGCSCITHKSLVLIRAGSSFRSPVWMVLSERVNNTQDYL